MKSGNSEEIPIWWRSDSSSRNIKRNNNDGKQSENLSKLSSRNLSTRTIKKWFSENQIDNKPLIMSEQKKGLKYNYPIKKLDLDKLNVTSQINERNNIKLISDTINSKNVCKPCFSSSNEDKSIYQESSSVERSFFSSCSYSSKSIPIPLFTISLPSSNSSQTSFLSSSSSSSSSLYSSSCSCSSYCSCFNSSTSFVDTLSSSLSYRSQNMREEDKRAYRKGNKKTNELSKLGTVGPVDSKLKGAINSVNNGILSIQKLPTIKDVPLNPYFCVDELNEMKVIRPENVNETESNVLEDYKKESIEQEYKPEGKKEYLERINKLYGWDELKQVMYNSVTIEQENVVLSFCIYHIELIVNKYEDMKEKKILKISPRITISIKSGSLSNQSVQNYSKITFMSNDKRYYWGENEDHNLNKKSTQNIQFMIQTIQLKDICSYFSVMVEGVELGEEYLEKSELDSVFLGVTFCPLPQKNDHWNITLPIYSAKREKNSYLDTKNELLVKYDYLPKDCEKVGFLSFKIFRGKLNDINLINAFTEQDEDNNKENKDESRIKSEIDTAKKEIKNVGSFSRTVVSGEVHYSICSFSTSDSNPVSSREKELQLREREINLKEKELELKIKALEMENFEQNFKIENKLQVKKDNLGVINKNVKSQRILHNHLFCEKKLNRYFKVNKKARVVSSKENVRILPLNNRKKGKGQLNMNVNILDVENKKEKVNSKSLNKHCRKSKSTSEKNTRGNMNIDKQILLSPINNITPVHLPILINQGVPVSTQTIGKSTGDGYLMYYNPTTLYINNRENVETSVNTSNVGKEINYIKQIGTGEEISGTMKPIIIPIRNECNFENKISDIYSRDRVGVCNSANISKKVENDSESNTNINKFLKLGLEVISIDSDIIRYDSGKCSNLNCRSNDNKIHYSHCEYTNMEIDYWSICEDCQIKMFPTLYNLSEDPPKFIEFFFDTSIPLYFPSKKSIWPTSLHFLLSQFTSDCEKVRKCRTYEDLVQLTRSMKPSLNNDIFPNIVKIIMVMKVFQHPALQKLLLSLTKKEFFMIKSYWIKNDYILNIFSSKSFGANIGVLLSETLENLKVYIQLKQR
ncbi:hypothetical protein FG379_002582 [Cryptosporidium bovis]|uniref:uncharacterized protein n=1 Tax=Cryptosporidium bovis TaxID=310047 RepID=UPI00351A2448|nr:hypothetical protein FG379_002582 [Cryptosporidium bovis]